MIYNTVVTVRSNGGRGRRSRQRLQGAPGELRRSEPTAERGGGELLPTGGP